MHACILDFKQQVGLFYSNSYEGTFEGTKVVARIVEFITDN